MKHIRLIVEIILLILLAVFITRDCRRTNLDTCEGVYMESSDVYVFYYEYAVDRFTIKPVGKMNFKHSDSIRVVKIEHLNDSVIHIITESASRER